MRKSRTVTGRRLQSLRFPVGVGGRLNTLFIRDLCEKGLPFEEDLQQTEAYRDSMNAYFVIETLDFLKKMAVPTGRRRLYRVGMNIKPVMGADSGTIIKLESGARHDQALDRMAVRARGRRYHKQTSGGIALYVTSGVLST